MSFALHVYIIFSILISVALLIVPLYQVVRESHHNWRVRRAAAKSTNAMLRRLWRESIQDKV